MVAEWWECKPWIFFWTHTWSWQTTPYLGKVVPPGKVEGPLSQWTGAIVHRLADPIVLSCHVETPALKVNVQYFRNIFSENYTSRNIHALNTVWKRLYASINPLIWYGSLFCMYLETIISQSNVGDGDPHFKKFHMHFPNLFVALKSSSLYIC